MKPNEINPKYNLTWEELRSKRKCVLCHKLIDRDEAVMINESPYCKGCVEVKKK